MAIARFHNFQLDHHRQTDGPTDWWKVASTWLWTRRDTRPMPYRWAWVVLQEGRGSYMGGCGLFTTRLDMAVILMHAFTRSLVHSFARCLYLHFQACFLMSSFELLLCLLLHTYNLFSFTTDRPIDRPTDRLTDRPTDGQSRVYSCSTRLNIKIV